MKLLSRVQRLERLAPRPVEPRILCLRIVTEPEEEEGVAPCPTPCPHVQSALAEAQPGQVAVFLICPETLSAETLTLKVPPTP